MDIVSVPPCSGTPDRQIAAPAKRLVVFSPVRHAILLLRDLITTISVEFVRHLRHPEGNKPRRYKKTDDPCNNAPPDSPGFGARYVQPIFRLGWRSGHGGKEDLISSDRASAMHEQVA